VNAVLVSAIEHPSVLNALAATGDIPVLPNGLVDLRRSNKGAGMAMTAPPSSRS